MGQLAVVGVVHSGKCFCPSRSPERIGNHCGRGTPLPLLCRLPPSWPARHGLGLGDARCGESAHRSSPRRVSGAPGLGGCARSIRPLGACMTNPACGGVIRNSSPGIPAAAGSPSLGSVTCACTRQPLAGRSFGRAVTTGAPRSDGAHRWRSGRPLKGCRSRPMGSAAGAEVDAFSCLAAAGSRETCRLGCPNFGRAMRDGHQAG